MLASGCLFAHHPLSASIDSVVLGRIGVCCGRIGMSGWEASSPRQRGEVLLLLGSRVRVLRPLLRWLAALANVFFLSFTPRCVGAKRPDAFLRQHPRRPPPSFAPAVQLLRVSLLYLCAKEESMNRQVGRTKDVLPSALSLSPAALYHFYRFTIAHSR